MAVSVIAPVLFLRFSAAAPLTNARVGSKIYLQISAGVRFVMCDLKGKTVMVFGDSIMYGSGNGGFGVGEYLERDLGMKCVKYAVGGARVGYVEGKNWLPGQIIRALRDGAEADYIVFDGFTNDCNISEGAAECDVPLGEPADGYDCPEVTGLKREGGTFAESFQSVLYTLLLRFPEAKILFIRPHNMGRRGDAEQKRYGELALSLCRKWGVPYVDLYGNSGMNTFIPLHRDLFTCDSYGWGRGDCTHPNAAGYELKYMPLIESALKAL